METEKVETNVEPNLASEVETGADLDALSAPEGSYDPDITGDLTMSITSEEGLLDSSNDHMIAPNIDDQIDPIESTTVEPKATEEVTTEPTVGTEYWRKPFEDLKSKYEDYNIPEDLNEENYMEHLHKTFTGDRNLHPDLIKIQDALDAGADIGTVMSDITNTRNVLDLNDRDLLRLEYQNTNKAWDDDKISQVLDKLDGAGMLEVEAERTRTRVQQYNESKLANLKAEEEAGRLARTNEVTAARNDQIGQALESFKNMDEVYGLPISKADKVEFNDFFTNLVTPDDTGQAPMFQMLQSNETLVKIAAMLWKGDEKVRSALTTAKENGKASFKDKLDSSPKDGYRSGAPAQAGNVDLDALSAPERLVI